ncbi:histidine phosphatase family protein [Bacillus spongiae]|uniref:Histidine phosphatase family protein n=1 Tax=Bacillus spongiae TaxID=2683610 RepID=A0ABU8HI62_9BACI
MNTTIYFVRHAHSIYTPDEEGRPLSDKGFCDAKKVASMLENRELHSIISSPYKRAQQTVEKLAEIKSLTINVIEDFKERRLAEEAVEHFDSAIKAVWKDELFAYEGGESNLEAQRRGVLAMENVLEHNRGKNIVIATHGNLMVLIMKHYHNQFDYDFWKQLTMPDIYQLTFQGNQYVEAKRVSGADVLF